MSSLCSAIVVTGNINKLCLTCQALRLKLTGDFVWLLQYPPLNLSLNKRVFSLRDINGNSVHKITGGQLFYQSLEAC